jgi:hypothetical protein
MAFGTEYRIEFTDDLGIDWQIDIQKDPDPGSVISLQASGNPITIEWYGNDDVVNQNIMGSEASINVECETNFLLVNLFSADNFDRKVIIYQNLTPYWYGYILANNFQEPYDTPPFTVTIQATDGLGLLKDFEFDDLDLTGRTSLAAIIHDILDQAGIDSFTEFVNIYEETCSTATGDSPLNQLLIDADVFKGYNCYDALNEILKIFNAGIRQDNGKFIIYRFREVADTTMHGRTYTSATTKSYTSQTPAQNIKRSGVDSYLEDYNGGMMTIIPHARIIKVFQDYGYKESWIDGWQFKAKDYDPYYLINPDSWEGWTGTMSIITKEVPEESDGVLFAAKGSVRDDEIYQSFGSYLKTTSDILGFSFDYYFYSWYGSDLTGVHIYIKVKADGANQWLKIKDAEDLEWSTSEAYIDITADTIANGRSGWINFSRSIPSGLPANGPYTITLYSPYSASTNNFALAYKNIRLFCTNDSIGLIKKTPTDPIMRLVNWIFPKWEPFSKHVKQYVDEPEIIEKTYAATNTVTGREINYRMMLGDVADSDIDNVVEQFAGSLATATLAYRVDTITLTGTNGSATVVCNGITKTVTYVTSTTQTATNFVTANAAVFLLSGITLTSDGFDLLFTSTALGVDYSGDTTITNASGDLAGLVVHTTAAIDITSLDYTTDWNTRGGSESKELLSIIADEFKTLYSRQKQLIELPLRETDASTFLKLTGNLQDSINQYSGNNRVFAISRAVYDIRSREWWLSLTEII